MKLQCNFFAEYYGRFCGCRSFVFFGVVFFFFFWTGLFGRFR